MSVRISFIIPVLNEQGHLGGVLQQLRQRFAGAELIAVDGGSEDDTVAQAMPHCDQLLVGSRGRAAQMNLGASGAAGEYLCFLHADSMPRFSESRLLEYLEQGPSWGFCRLRLSGRQRVFRVIEWFINQRSRLSRIGTGDQMLFLRRDVFVSTGGFDAIPLMEDVAYCKRLRRESPPLIIREGVTTSSRRWEQQGVMATVVRMWVLRLAYFVGVSPQRLHRHYSS